MRGGICYVWYDTFVMTMYLGGGDCPLGLNPAFCNEAPCSADIQVKLFVFVMLQQMCV